MTFEDLFQMVAAEGGELSLTFGRNDRHPSEANLRVVARMPDGKVLKSERFMLRSAARMSRVAGGEERFHLRDAVCELGDVVAQRLLSPSRVVSVLMGGGSTDRQERGE